MHMTDLCFKSAARCHLYLKDDSSDFQAFQTNLPFNNTLSDSLAKSKNRVEGQAAQPRW